MGNIAEFVADRAEALVYEPEDVPLKKVSVRIPEDDVADLDALAGKLSYTRSGLAAELLVRAIHEAKKAAAGNPILEQIEGVDPEQIALIADHEEAGTLPQVEEGAAKK